MSTYYFNWPCHYLGWINSHNRLDRIFLSVGISARPTGMTFRNTNDSGDFPFRNGVHSWNERPQSFKTAFNSDMALATWPVTSALVISLRLSGSSL
jgi:hypothetical protein